MLISWCLILVTDVCPDIFVFIQHLHSQAVVYSATILIELIVIAFEKERILWRDQWLNNPSTDEKHRSWWLLRWPFLISFFYPILLKRLEPARGRVFHAFSDAVTSIYSQEITSLKKNANVRNDYSVTREIICLIFHIYYLIWATLSLTSARIFEH